MDKSLVYFFLVAVNLAFIGGSTEPSKAADFYDGKTLRFVVGSAPGGGYDTYTREVKDLPLFKNVIKDPKKFAIYKAWADQMDFQRPLALPPGTPKERLESLRKALGDVLKDKALLDEAKKAKLVITYVSGEQTTKIVDEILSIPEDVKKSLSFLVRTKKS